MTTSSFESNDLFINHFAPIKNAVECEAFIQDLNADQLIQLFGSSIQPAHYSETEVARPLILRKIQTLHTASTLNPDQLNRIRKLCLQVYPQIHSWKEQAFKENLIALFTSTLRHKNLWDVEEFFKLSLNPSSPNKAIDQQLFFALRKNYIELIPLLIEAGANIHATDMQGETPLFDAIRSGDIDTVTLFLQHGAHIHHVNRHQMTPFELSLHFRNYDITKLFLDSSNWTPPPCSRSLNDNQSLLENPIKDHNIDMIKSLLAKGVSLHQGATPPLMYAIECLNHSSFSFSYSLDDWDQEPLLLSTIQDERLQIIQFFLDAGADVNAEDNIGRTPLILAIETGNIQVVRLLLQRGAEIASVNKEKSYASMTYLESFTNDKNVKDNHAEIVELLVASGAEIRKTNSQNSSFLIDVKKFGSTGKRIWAAAKQRPGTDEAIRYAKNYLQFKLLSHAFAINSTIDIEGTKVRGSGMVALAIAPAKIASLSSKFSQAYPEAFDPASSTEFAEAVRLAVDHLTMPASVYLERIQSGKPTIILIGYSESGSAHAATALFWNGLLFICNRSEMRATQQIGRYDSSKIDIDIIQELLNLHTNPRSNYQEALHKSNARAPCGTLLSKISFTSSSNDEALTKLVKLPNQIIGNCSWAAPEGILYAYWILTQLQKNNFRLPEIPEEVTTLKASADAFFSHWLTFTQDHLLAKYQANGFDPVPILSLTAQPGPSHS